ncbi:MAG TPA: hypothetical protein VN581_03855 [Patescibacteria group bacterium]|nr:hypothetical protein [Patescibacteria group bacterium]
MKRYLLALALALTSTAAFAEYSFVVHNNTDSKIVKIRVSEDGSSWGQFDIGKGIPAGSSSQLIWDPSTDDSGCEWLVRATFADGSESEDVTFDFCEEGLELDFN